MARNRRGRCESERTYLIGKSVDWHTKCPRQTKVSQLQFTFPVDQKILGFKIAVQDPILMTECGSLEKLIHEAPDSHGVQCTAFTMRVHVFFQILIAILEYENEFGFRMDDIVKPDDVDVFKLFHEGDLTDRCRWSAFFGIQMNLLERNDFVCSSGATLQWI